MFVSNFGMLNFHIVYFVIEALKMMITILIIVHGMIFTCLIFSLYVIDEKILTLKIFQPMVIWLPVNITAD